jgi:DNA primase
MSGPQRRNQRPRMSDADFRFMVDEVRHRHRLSDVIGSRTKLVKAGKEVVGLCPFHSERSASFRVNDAKGLYHCFGCAANGDAIRFIMAMDGLSFMDAVRVLAGSDLPVFDDAARVRAAEEDAADRAKAVADARYVWSRCVPVQGTPAEAYARFRGIASDLPDSIRFGVVPGWRDRETGEWGPIFPALVGACVDAGGELVAIQRIFIEPKGQGKARMKKPKKSLGRIKGAALRLGPPAEEVIVCEGPEDGLTLMQGLPGASVWVALGTALMATMEFPPEVRTVTLAGDNNEAGRDAVRRAAEALTLRGLHVKAMYPAPEFRDWNDELNGVRI